MKTAFHFNAFAVLLSLVLLDAAVLLPGLQAGDEPMATPPAGILAKQLPPADTTRFSAAGSPRLRITAATRRKH